MLNVKLDDRGNPYLIRGPDEEREYIFTTENPLNDLNKQRNALDFTSNTSSGGDAIQAAIDDLPQKGGTVFIPSNGPDDNVTESGKQLDEDGVWMIDNKINVPQMGVRVVGDSRGTMGTTQGTSTGTVLMTPNSAKQQEYQIRFEKSAGCGIANLRMDGGTASIGDNNVDSHIELDNVDEDNVLFSFNAHNIYTAHADVASIRVNGVSGSGSLSNIMVTNSLLTDSGANILVDNAPSFCKVFMLNVTSSLSDKMVDIQDNIGGIIGQNITISANSNASNTDAFNINDQLGNLTLSQVDEFRYDNSFLKVTNNGEIFRGGLDHIFINGNSVQNHIIDNQGTITDFDISKINPIGLTGSKYVNFVNDPTNAPRCTINGLGYNGLGDPSSTGVWNNNGEEGIRVLWENQSGDFNISEYINGYWYSRSL